MSWFSSGYDNCWLLVIFDIYRIQRGLIKYVKSHFVKNSLRYAASQHVHVRRSQWNKKAIYPYL